jgi:hypothetical protein
MICSKCGTMMEAMGYGDMVCSECGRVSFTDDLPVCRDCGDQLEICPLCGWLFAECCGGSCGCDYLFF